MVAFLFHIALKQYGCALFMWVFSKNTKSWCFWKKYKCKWQIPECCFMTSVISYWFSFLLFGKSFLYSNLSCMGQSLMFNLWLFHFLSTWHFVIVFDLYWLRLFSLWQRKTILVQGNVSWVCLHLFDVSICFIFLTLPNCCKYYLSEHASLQYS